MLNKNLSDNTIIFIKILAQLKVRDRIILIDRFAKQKTLKEVGKKLGVTDAAIKGREDYLINLIEQTFEYNKY